MNPTHIHLLLNHFPIIGTLIGSAILIFGLLKKKPQLVETASAILFLMALAAIPVYLTGEPTEESVEKLPGVSEALIEAHEEAASIAIWIMELTGLLGLVIWIGYRLKNNWPAKLGWLTAIVSLLCFASMARTGYLGGQIRHTEIRAGVTGGGQAVDPGEKHDDD